MQNVNRKRIIIIAAVSCLMIVMAVLGTSLAVLTSKTEQRANNFTFGNVKIDLKEPEWDDLTPEEKIVYPGKSVKKDPQIENTGNNDLYAYIEVSVPKAAVRTVADDGTTINAAQPQELFSFTPNSGWTLIDTNDTADDYCVKLYAYTAKVLKPGETTGKLFDNVTYLNILEGELSKGTVLEMPINAYAIQSDYLNETGSNMEEKMKNAFEKYNAETVK